MLSGCKIKPSSEASIPHKTTRLHIWKKRVTQEGGTFLEADSHDAATHLLAGNERTPVPAGPAAQEANSNEPVLVHYSWLEGCLAKRRHLSEADYHPAALAVVAAASSRGGDGAAAPSGGDGDGGSARIGGTPASCNQHGGSGTARSTPVSSPASLAAAAPAAASAAASGRPLLRQVAVRSPTLTAADVQQLLVHLLADAQRPHWLSVHGRPSTVVVVEVPGLDRQLLQERLPEEGPLLLHRLLTGIVKQRVLLQGTAANEVASQTTATLLSVPQPGGRGGQKRKQPEPLATVAAAAAGAAGRAPTPAQHGEQQGAATTAGERAFPPAFYATTARQMRVVGWPQGCAEAAAAAEAAEGGPGPVHGSAATAAGQALPPGWVSTAQQQQRRRQRQQQQAPVSAQMATAAAGEADEQPVVAVDCEMVITASGFELARVSLLGGGGKRLLDTLVVPDSPVLDYNTRYSGITAEMLKGVTTRVADAQRLVLHHIGPHTLLVGHTLENDLKALRMVHGRCIDSAMLFPHPRGLPHRSSLRILAQRLLGRAIQQGAHDSFIDAEVALQVVQLKFRHGPTFATAKQGCTHLLELLAARGRRLALVAPREVLMLHAVPQAQLVTASSNSQALAATLRVLGARQPAAAAAAAAGGSTAAQQVPAAPASSIQQQSPAGQQAQQRQPLLDLLWLQLGELWGHLQERAAHLARQDGVLNLGAAVAAAQEDPQPRRILQQVDRLLMQLVAALPPGALLLVLSGQGDTALCRTLQGEGSRHKEEAAARQAAAKASRPVHALVQRAQQGVCLVALSGQAELI